MVRVRILNGTNHTSFFLFFSFVMRTQLVAYDNEFGQGLESIIFPVQLVILISIDFASGMYARPLDMGYKEKVTSLPL